MSDKVVGNLGLRAGGCLDMMNFKFGKSVVTLSSSSIRFHLGILDRDKEIMMYSQKISSYKNSIRIRRLNKNSVEINYYF